MKYLWTFFRQWRRRGGDLTQGFGADREGSTLLLPGGGGLEKLPNLSRTGSLHMVEQAVHSTAPRGSIHTEVCVDSTPSGVLCTTPGAPGSSLDSECVSFSVDWS